MYNVEFSALISDCEMHTYSSKPARGGAYLFNSPITNAREHTYMRQSAGSIGVMRAVFEVISSHHASRDYRFASGVIGSYTPWSATANKLSVLMSANTT